MLTICFYLCCTQAKSDIHSSISRQLETLRSREVWLLNQVDTIRHIKEDSLQGQLACLLHELGGFQHLMQMAQSCSSNSDLKQEFEETLSRLESSFSLLVVYEIRFDSTRPETGNSRVSTQSVLRPPRWALIREHCQVNVSDHL